ncbi:hypothetical protein GCM10025871_33770 [Deinococcus metallilatus]|nr:hypothetical protein GCM10025871_33770 [Deinococcus metallilatus]
MGLFCPSPLGGEAGRGVDGIAVPARPERNSNPHERLICITQPLPGDWYSSHRERLGLVELLAEGWQTQLALTTSQKPVLSNSTKNRGFASIPRYEKGIEPFPNA